ncbi:MAG: TonB-dependent receptor [Thiopseudomonas sp.]|nr:TonB-dependent receptor [Thiopseudomonas sp.]
MANDGQPVAPPAHLFPLQVGDSVNSDTATMETTSAFMQDEWTLPNDFKLIAGVRYYHVKTRLDKTEGSRHNAGENSAHSRFVKSLGITWTGLPHTTFLW